MPQRIASIAGDGIGPEVMASAYRVLDHFKGEGSLDVEVVPLPWGSEYFRSHGRMMPVDGIEILSGYDAILLGAVGVPDIPDTETLWGLLIPIRREFDQYVNLRPVKTLPGVTAPLRSATNIDLVVVRENTEGEYSEIGGRIGRGTAAETALQTASFSRTGVQRIARYAAELAQRRAGKLISATKSNGIIHSMPFWDEIVEETLQASPDVELRSVLIDALAAALVLHPDRFDVIVASNLFGDILSDLASALTGSIGVAPSANLNPERRHPSLFEPVHGSAPDIAGNGIANPVGQLWSVAMMLEHLGRPDLSTRVEAAFRDSLAAGCATPDVGGTATTDSFTDSVIERL